MWGSCVNLRLVDVTKKEEFFPTTSHHCEGLKLVFFHIGTPDKTSTDGQILTNVINGMVKTFGLEKYCWIQLK